MKSLFVCTAFLAISLVSSRLSAQTHLFIDVHHLGAGKVTAEAVADAHAKDLAVQKKYGTQFIKYWVDEKAGDVYCLLLLIPSRSAKHMRKRMAFYPIRFTW
jgi:hypothetical protein